VAITVVTFFNVGITIVKSLAIRYLYPKWNVQMYPGLVEEIVSGQKGTTHLLQMENAECC
jgi:hypothetical protein